MANINGNEIYFGITLTTGGGSDKMVGSAIGNTGGVTSCVIGTMTPTEEA